MLDKKIDKKKYFIKNKEKKCCVTNKDKKIKRKILYKNIRRYNVV